ncbi:nicotinate-nucleotide--dimethylbenzimidazole phosphoribosyltransferase [Prosthecomicrobium hirschii]|uniref:nicotinate-nucleotide--dimethylbenzimidazole phosphoribosyltransferase n=1 Tax=Prosthecodimorpha hirschii TaxID=665126 RepID=UPI00112D0370|nr:nicotinate-nucleotide--dimethylbenzimidazole phosphoribosyltransferase [Prosthecomicrobium hirschii]TPQ52940.1 nicotinate-nucleotide--dimethylbenzimidazole phosphoribosyltransferase [Prosthecomicrobium hirschii]
MADTALPFDDFRDLVNLVPGPDEAAVAAVQARDRDLTKPAGALGRMEAIVEWLAAWQGKAPPAVDRPLVAVFAANHGVTAQGVSAFPASVTRAMVENFAAGGAAINQICAASDIGLKVFELALDHPTPDISLEDAFDEAGCAATMAFGMEALAGQPDLLCLGEMGIGNTTVAAALFLALFGGEAADWVGPGTGVGGAALAKKVAVVERAVARLDGRLSDPLEILRRLGGREIAAMAGAILAARHQKVPVVVDGFVTTAAAAVLWAANPAALDHCLFAHVSAEPAHARALAAMGKVPLLDLGMRLGEGTGAALAAGLVRIAAKTHAGMATFTQAGVAGKLD